MVAKLFQSAGSTVDYIISDGKIMETQLNQSIGLVHQKMDQHLNVPLAKKVFIEANHKLIGGDNAFAQSHVLLLCGKVLSVVQNHLKGDGEREEKVILLQLLEEKEYGNTATLWKRPLVGHLIGMKLSITSTALNMITGWRIFISQIIKNISSDTDTLLLMVTKQVIKTV